MSSHSSHGRPPVLKQHALRGWQSPQSGPVVRERKETLPSWKIPVLALQSIIDKDARVRPPRVTVPCLHVEGTPGNKLLFKAESHQEPPGCMQSNRGDRSFSTYSSYSPEPRSSGDASPARSEGDTLSRKKSTTSRGCRAFSNRSRTRSRSCEIVRVETTPRGGSRTMMSCCPSAASDSEVVPHSARSRRSGRPRSRVSSVAATSAHHGSQHLLRHNIPRSAARTSSRGACQSRSRTPVKNNKRYTRWPSLLVESDPGSMFPQVFWMRPAQLRREYLCLVYTEAQPLCELLANAGNLMASWKHSCQPTLDDSMDGEPLADLMRVGLPNDLFWTVGKHGGSFDCIGIGRNKKVRHKATKLAIAVARYCEGDTADFSWAPESFKKLVDHASSTRDGYFSHIPQSATEEGTRSDQVAPGEPYKTKKRKDWWTSETNPRAVYTDESWGKWTEQSTKLVVDTRKTKYHPDIVAALQVARWRMASKPRGQKSPAAAAGEVDQEVFQ